MATHVMALGITFAAFLLLAVSYFGWGKLLFRLLGVGGGARQGVAIPIWLGWATTLFGFQLVHLGWPLSGWIVAPVLLAGLVPAALFRREVRRREIWGDVPAWQILLVAGAFACYAVWLASKAMWTPVLYDSGLYHFQTIRWLNTHPIVPGLGNLHDRLAFNQSYFAYVASLNLFPYFGHGRSLANSFLVLLTVGMFLPSVLDVLRRPLALRGRHSFRLLGLFVIPLVLYRSLAVDYMASPSPHLSVSLLLIVLFDLLMRGVADWRAGHREQDMRCVSVILLAATAVTVKLSTVVVAGAIAAAALAYWWRRYRLRWRAWLRPLVPAAAVLVLWMGRGVILSGAPLMPSTAGYVEADWAMPREAIVKCHRAIAWWARDPGIHGFRSEDGWAWLTPWLGRAWSCRTAVVFPLAGGVVCLALAALLHAWWKQRPGGQWLVVVPIAAGLVFWFFTAPGLRFSRPLFWLLFVAGALLLLDVLRTRFNAKAYLGALVVIFAAGHAPLCRDALARRYELGRISRTGWHEVPTASLKTATTASGLRVHVPVEGQMSWEAPLPCALRLHPNLRLRTPGDLSSGFTVAPPEAAGEQRPDVSGSSRR
ncbi:MAG: LIC_10190 family membrane protein [Planctomycetota bacterium]